MGQCNLSTCQDETPCGVKFDAGNYFCSEFICQWIDKFPAENASCPLVYFLTFPVEIASYPHLIGISCELWLIVCDYGTGIILQSSIDLTHTCTYTHAYTNHTGTSLSLATSKCSLAVRYGVMWSASAGPLQTECSRQCNSLQLSNSVHDCWLCSQACFMSCMIMMSCTKELELSTFQWL